MTDFLIDACLLENGTLTLFRSVVRDLTVCFSCEGVEELGVRGLFNESRVVLVDALLVTLLRAGVFGVVGDIGDLRGSVESAWADE